MVEKFSGKFWNDNKLTTFPVPEGRPPTPSDCTESKLKMPISKTTGFELWPGGTAEIGGKMTALIYRKFGQNKIGNNFSSTSGQDFISICTIGLQSQIPIFGLSHPGILAVLVHVFLLICVMGLIKVWLRRLLASSDQSFPTLILESSSGTVL